MLSEVENSAEDGLDGADVGIADTCKPDDFAAHTILLVGEGEGGKSSLLELFNWCSGEVDVCISDEPGHLLSKRDCYCCQCIHQDVEGRRRQ